ncbi:MAG: hypothetical protein V4461_00420 [Pseudomonadota bacterium]
MKNTATFLGAGLLGALVTATLIYTVPALLPKDNDDMEPATATPAVRQGVVTLDPDHARRANITIITLAPAKAAVVRSGFARALDIGPLSAIQSEIVSASAALAASRADATRQLSLAQEDQSASARAVEMARAQAIADQARLDLAQRRVGLEYGSGLGHFSPIALGNLVGSVAAGRASLVRIDFPDVIARRGTLIHVGSDVASAELRVLGAAAVADTHLQSAGALAIAYGPLAQALATGKVLSATMQASGKSDTGVLVPRGAILRYQGGLWVYRVQPGGGFARVELIGARLQADGWFVQDGVKAGDRVAADGVAVLLSLERGGEAAAEDD